VPSAAVTVIFTGAEISILTGPDVTA